MRVYHLLYSITYSYGGPAFSVPIQCKGLSRMGYDMSILAYENRNEINVPIDDEIQLVMVEREKNIIDKIFSRRLKQKLASIPQPDIVHLHGVWLPLDYLGAKWALKKNIPYVINPRGDLEIARVNSGGFLKRIKKKIALFLYSKMISDKAACLIATSAQEAHGIRYFGIKTPIAIIPNGINVGNFPLPNSRIKHNPKVLLFLSRINPIKGIDILLKVWKTLPDEILDQWELHIVGNSDPASYVNELQSYVQKNNLQRSVKFLGQLTGKEKFEKYLSSDLFVLPTLNENFGNVIAEAMMCELPVITTKNAPWEGIIEHNCGWWIDLTPKDLKSALIEAMTTSEEKLETMGKRGRKYVIDTFSEEIARQKTLELYNWVMKTNSIPSFVQIV